MSGDVFFFGSFQQRHFGDSAFVERSDDRVQQNGVFPEQRIYERIGFYVK